FAPDIVGIDPKPVAAPVRGLKGDLVQNLFHDGVEAAGPDILGALVDQGRKFGDLLQPIGGEFDLHLFSVHQRLVLRGKRIGRLLQDAQEIVFAKGVELDADRKAALKLGDEVARLGDVKGPGSDEQDMIGTYHAVLGIDVTAFHDRQDVALHPFAGD